MPLIPQMMQGLITAKAASSMMSGSKMIPFVGAISNATCQYILLSAVVNSTNIATGPGAGTQVGRVVGLIPNAMSMLIQMKAAVYGIVGKDSRRLFQAVSFGVCTSMNAVVMNGVIIGAGPGSGIGKIVGLIPTALSNFIYTQEIFRGLAGSKIRQTVSAIAFGVCTHIMTAGTVTITDIGAFAPPPVGPVPIPAAPGIGRLY
jgi:uncharacterized membrane protein